MNRIGTPEAARITAVLGPNTILGPVSPGVPVGPAPPEHIADGPEDDPIAVRPPWAVSGFWVLQLVVLALSLIRLAALVTFHPDATTLVVEFSTLALFIIPVVYAALNYGFSGAAATSGWVSVLAIPRFLAAVSARQYVAAWAELLQLVLLDTLALLIGQRVSSERDARRSAEMSRLAHLNAEAMYRDLFDSNQAPILIIDHDGLVVETNAAAQRSFVVERSVTAGSAPVRLVDMIGPDAAARILTQLISWRTPSEGRAGGSPSEIERVEPLPFEIAGERVLFRPSATPLGMTAGDSRMQVIFEDVTAETRRHDQMEAYAAQVVLGQEEERRHIAQEIHDGPLQSLIHLCRQIDTIESAPRAGDPTRPTPPLSEVRTIAEETVAELRSIARGLRPSILDDLGLVASISQMLTDGGLRHQWLTSFGVTGTERRLSPIVELALFRMAQEALSNVERHAAAHRVAVGVDFEAGGLRLLVKDDGVGFDTSAGSEGSRPGSMGLAGMNERAHLVGSRLTIHSQPGAGTTVDVWVPATILDQT